MFNYDILEKWFPDKDTKGIGLTILLLDEIDNINKEDLIDFVNKMGKNKPKVSIKVYSDIEAYNEDKNNTYTDKHKEGLIFVSVKNKTDIGAFQGFNEIRWMQEIGKFSDMFGQVTKI